MLIAHWLASVLPNVQDASDLLYNIFLRDFWFSYNKNLMKLFRFIIVNYPLRYYKEQFLVLSFVITYNFSTLKWY